MAPFRRITLVAAPLLFVVAAPVSRAAEMPAAEKAKIEALIKHVGDLKDAKFVRNDQEHDPTTAVRFLQGKWDASAAEIKTAKDFIDKAATKSSTTGKPYLIRFKDGKEQKVAEYLLAELKKREKPADGKRDPTDRHPDSL